MLLSSVAIAFCCVWSAALTHAFGVATVAGLFLWLGILRTGPARVAAAAMFGDRLGPSFAIGVVAVLVGLRLTLSPA